MLLPQYSIRWLLVVTGACACVFTVFGLAVRGHLWAIGISLAFGALALVMLVYGLLFLASWVISAVVATRGRASGRPGHSPFGDGTVRTGPPADDKDIPAEPILLQ